MFSVFSELQFINTSFVLQIHSAQIANLSDKKKALCKEKKKKINVVFPAATKAINQLYGKVSEERERGMRKSDGRRRLKAPRNQFCHIRTISLLRGERRIDGWTLKRAVTGNQLLH